MIALIYQAELNLWSSVVDKLNVSQTHTHTHTHTHTKLYFISVFKIILPCLCSEPYELSLGSPSLLFKIRFNIIL